MHPQPTPPQTSRTKRWLKRLRWVPLFYLAPLAIISCGHVADLLILHPWVGPIDAKGALREVITIDGAQVELWHALSPGAQGTATTPAQEPIAFVLFFVGNSDRADRWASFNAAQWGDKPVEVVGMNYPGFGGSTGPARLAKLGPAALAAFDWVNTQASAGGHKRPIFIMANSIGTTAALCVMARRDVAGATLQNPPPLQRLLLGHHGWWNLWLVAGPIALAIPSDLDSLANARNAKAPAVFILSEKDQTVPVAYQRMIYQQYAGEKHLVDLPNASHNQGMDQAAWDEVGRQIEWLWQKSFPPTSQK